MRARKHHRGAVVIEYILAATLIILVAAFAATKLQNSGSNELRNQADCVSTRPPPPSCQVRSVTTSTSVTTPTSSSTTATTTATTAPTTATTAPTTTATTAPTTTATTAPTTTATTAPTTTATTAPPGANSSWRNTSTSANTPDNSHWRASAEVRVRNGSTNVVGATVTIQVRTVDRNGNVATYNRSCITGSNGRCTFDEDFPDSGSGRIESATFTITSISGGTPAVSTGTPPSPQTFNRP